MTQKLEPSIQYLKINEETKEYHRNRLLELSKSDKGKLIEYPDGRVYRNDKLIAEFPTYEQICWFNRRIEGSARTYESCIEHKPWIFRWNYCVVGDYQ